MTDPDARMANRLMYLVPAADVPDGPERHAHVELAAGPRMAIAAAHEAVADAGLDDAQCERLSVVLGVEMGNATATRPGGRPSTAHRSAGPSAGGPR